MACNHQLSIAVINFHRYSANLSAASFTYTQLMVDYTDYTCTVILDIGQTPCVTLQQRIIYRLHDIQSSSAGRRVCPAVHIVIKILKTFHKIIKFLFQRYRNRNLTIWNIIRWFASSLGQMTSPPRIWCSKHVQTSSAGRRVCPALNIVNKILETFQKIIKILTSDVSE